MRELLSDKDFVSKILCYNAAYSFVSFSAKTDDTLKSGIYTFRVHGLIHHRIGPLQAQNENSKKQCAQIYINDGELQDQLRENYSPDLQPIILKNLNICYQIARIPT